MTRTKGQESKRDRVRRIVFKPLEEDGIRPNPKVKARKEGGEVVETREDRHRRFLDALADDVAHMSEDALIAWRDTIRFNTVTDAAGRPKPKDRCGCWPSRIVLLDWANRIEAFPIDKVPGLKGWFASVEGPRALERDTAVETFLWIWTHKRPPYRNEDMAVIRRQAEDRRRDMQRHRDRMDRGMNAHSENELARYAARLEKVTDLIRAFRGDKGMLA